MYKPLKHTQKNEFLGVFLGNGHIDKKIVLVSSIEFGRHFFALLK
jgi:hypothetical protein